MAEGKNAPRGRLEAGFVRSSPVLMTPSPLIGMVPEGHPPRRGGEQKRPDSDAPVSAACLFARSQPCFRAMRVPMITADSSADAKRAM